MKRSAFTMVELIFVIVIVGILASISIPKLSGVSDNAKKAAEIATFSAVATAIETVHGEWSINEGDFKWGLLNQPSSTLDPRSGYPFDLNTSTKVFGKVLKGDTKEYKTQPKPVGFDTADYNITLFTGPATDAKNGVKLPKIDVTTKPDKNDYWVYVHSISTDANCTIGTKVLYAGDFVLIDDSTNTPRTTYDDLKCNP